MSIFSLLMPIQYVCCTSPFTIFLTPVLQSVSPNSLNFMVASAADDSSIIGICGEMKLDNKEESWWTMIQVSLEQLYLGRYLHKLVALQVLHLPSFIKGIQESVWLSHHASCATAFAQLIEVDPLSYLIILLMSTWKAMWTLFTKKNLFSLG